MRSAEFNVLSESGTGVLPPRTKARPAMSGMLMVQKYATSAILTSVTGISCGLGVGLSTTEYRQSRHDEHGSMLVPNAPIATGKEALAQAIAGDFAHGDTTWHPKKVGVARSGELGYTSGTTDLTFKDTSAKTVTSKGNYLTVWKKETDGSWKVLFDSFNFE